MPKSRQWGQITERNNSQRIQRILDELLITTLNKEQAMEIILATTRRIRTVIKIDEPEEPNREVRENAG